MMPKEPIDWQRRASLWEQRAARLWQLLDDIDTLGDSLRPPRNTYFRRVNAIARKRVDVLHSDGYTLRLPLGGSEGRIAELETEVRRGRELITRDRTGLAEGLNAVRKLLKGFRWLGDPGDWSSYSNEERSIETLRREMASCITQAEELCGKALYASGARADSSFHDGPHVPAAPEDKPAPVPMILYCPMCTERHIDEGEFETKVHHTHSCQSCGHTWRPAVVPTVGVMYLPGFKNESGTALSDEELGRRLWAFAVDMNGTDAEHAEALGRRARQLVPGFLHLEQRDQLIELFHQLWGTASSRQYDKSLWARMQRLLGDG